MVVLLSKIPIFGYYFLSPDQQVEYNVHWYTRLFQKALAEGRQMPSECKEVDRLARAMKSTSHTPEAIQACEELVWMSKVSKDPDYVKAERMQGGYRLKILPEALNLPWDEFCSVVLPIVNGQNHPVVIGEKEYTSKAVSICLGVKRLQSLRDFTKIADCRFRGDKKQNWTVAQIRSLGIEPDVDLSEVDEPLFQFVYETFVEGRHLDPAWWNRHTHDEFFRLQSFVQKFMKQRKVTIPEFNPGWQNILTIREDRLLLEPDQFQKEMRALLNFYPSFGSIHIEQSKSNFPLFFEREKFIRLVGAKIDPQLLRATYKIKTEDGEITEITSDVFYQVLTFLSERAGPQWKASDAFEISHAKQTLEHAVQYVKTVHIPFLTWADEKRLWEFLKQCAPGTSWEKSVHDVFVKRTPYLSTEELELYQWSGLALFLEPYEESCTVHLGSYVYFVKTLRMLIEKAPLIPVSLLSKPVWFQREGRRLQADLSVLQFYPEVLKIYPEKIGTGESHNPIHFPDSQELFNFSKVEEFKASFKLLQSWNVFLQPFHLPGAASLNQCSQIYIGDKFKTPPDYWNEVQQELKKYPQAKEIVLDGCTKVWQRERVQVFCEMGTITIEDLNTPVLLHFSLKGTDASDYQRCWLAEWKCLSSEDPAIDRSGKTNPRDLILSKDYQMFYVAMFGNPVRENLNLAKNPFLRLLTPFALQKIFPQPDPPKRTFSTVNTAAFYAQRILAVFCIALASYLAIFDAPFIEDPLEKGLALGAISSFVFFALVVDERVRKTIVRLGPNLELPHPVRIAGIASFCMAFPYLIRALYSAVDRLDRKFAHTVSVLSISFQAR
jgi:hypothetical protein